MFDPLSIGRGRHDERDWRFGTYPLKDSVDTIVFRLEGEQSSVKHTDLVLVPADRFRYPVGVRGPTIPASRISVRYEMCGLDLEYESFQSLRTSRVFERLAIGSEDRSELFLYGNALFHYPKAGDYHAGGFTKLSSEGKLVERVVSGIAPRLGSDERSQLFALIGSLRA